MDILHPRSNAEPGNGGVACTRNHPRLERAGAGGERRSEGSPWCIPCETRASPQLCVVTMWRCCGWAALRGLGNGRCAERTSPTVPQVQVCTLVVTAGEGLVTPLRSSSLVGNPSGERSSILLGSPGRGRNPQVSQAGNAGKPDNEDEYRHRLGACATALGRSRAKLSFQFEGTLSNCRSGTDSPPSRICHTAPGRGGHEVSLSTRLEARHVA